MGFNSGFKGLNRKDSLIIKDWLIVTIMGIELKEVIFVCVRLYAQQHSKYVW